ncbi:MAG: site-2 protease family protein [Armatimonadota bacterium]
MSWRHWAQAVGVIGGTVVLHEMAHALAARRAGGVVKEIGIGFGPPVVRARWGETTVTLRPMPIGGFAAIDVERLPPALRTRVLLAGPLANILAGLILRQLGGATGPAMLPGQTRPVEVGGLVAALTMLVRAASGGARSLVRTAGDVNLSIGLANLLPILPLDGGHLAAARLEAAGADASVIAAFKRITAGLFVWLALRVLFADLARLKRSSGSSAP